ncbi:CRTAC1 family protein [Alloacidobacterium dinghuense]|uniref:CRTAC1 family protein n=1 Tax=Alloacidobacterium dinghuense TaxID=2763107 RepID=A0A7G8BQ64_9BACT|nr:CRTAC1 family protein [Alloacidobacterium dinghuense]QNI34684.1 CRTAC1 family protein [Alloacidobacterium dinghuense]
MLLRVRVVRLFPLVAILLISGCTRTPSTPAPKNEEPTASHPAAAVAPESNTSVEAAPVRPSGPIRFTDVTTQAGIHFKHNSGAFGKKYLPETMGSGVCVLDYDNDGWQDILFVNSMDWPEHKTSKSYPALYHNNKDGTFTDVTRQAGLEVEMYGLGCAAADYDNDGFDDIYITALDGNHLFRNLGNGKFADVTGKAGVRDPGFSTGAVWFDYDNDGKLDLFVSHYVEWSPATDQYCTLDGKHKSYCTPELYKGQSATLYHNKGNGTFEDVTKKAGLYDPGSKSLGVVLLDYDDDGWMDLFVANDTQANKLYHNNHNGTFTDEAFATGVAFSDAGKARAGMGADAADYDLSGHQSLVIGNFANESMALYQNDGSGLFTDKAMTDGIGPASASSLTFSTFFFDYDLDGLPDIFAANGHVADDVSVVTPTLHYAEPPLLFHNKGNGKFEDVTDKVGSALRQPMVGRGAAYLDFDNDGDLDLVMTTSNGPAKLLRNDNGNQNDMLKVKAIGTRSNRDGIGAKITVKTSKGLRLFGMVRDGSSYLSQSELPLTFGLGKPDADKTVVLEIVWPSGKKESIPNIKVNQFITLEEGKGMISAVPIVFSKPKTEQ